jgi:hypothetical protein
MLSGYLELIIGAVGCSTEEAVRIEEFMRDVVFHSTLDWQTRSALEEGARIAHAALRQLGRNLPAER